MLDQVERMLRHGSFALALVSAAMILAMPLFISYSTIMRYVAGTPLSVTEELSSFMLVSCIFLALPHAAMQGKHIAIQFLLPHMRPALRDFVGVVTNGVAFLFLVLLTKLTYDFTMTGYLLNAHSETSHIYEAPWRAIMPLSSAWLALIALFFAIRHGTALIQRNAH